MKSWHRTREHHVSQSFSLPEKSQNLQKLVKISQLKMLKEIAFYSTKLYYTIWSLSLQKFFEAA